jgi:hypothetical protein
VRNPAREFVTEADYISELKSRWPQGSPASREILSLAAEAVRDFPQSALLWFLRGQLIRMAPPDYIFSKLDAVCSFEEAIRLDPAFVEACAQIGYYHSTDEDAEPTTGRKEAKRPGRPPRRKPPH